MNAFKKLALVAVGLVAAAQSQAAAIDVAAVATAVGEVVGPITTIGSGVLLVIVALKTFKWVRAAIG